MPQPAQTAADQVGEPLDFRRASLTLACSAALVGVVALLDLVTGVHLSLSVFYLAPVAGCAWWCGSTLALLPAVLAATAGHMVDQIENPTLPVTTRLWNDVVRFCTLVLVASLAARLQAALRRERRLAQTDPLTGAANARTFYESAATESRSARQSALPLTLAYFDLDDFKLLNDRHGHAAGDEALRQIVRTVRQHLRRTDLLARLGGDEFAVLLPGADAQSVAVVLARVQDAVLKEMAGRGWPVTLSLGAVTFCRPPVDVDVMVRHVDALMYRAKRAGKARIEHAVFSAEEANHEAIWPGPERRSAARLPCNRAARVCPQGTAGTEGEPGSLRNISAVGVGLLLGRRLPPETVVVIESLSPGVRALLARILRVEPDGTGWMHGCVLAESLDASALSNWADTGQGGEKATVRNDGEERPASDQRESAGG